MVLKNEINRVYIHRNKESNAVYLMLEFQDGKTIAIRLTTIEFFQLIKQGVLIEDE